MAQHKIDRLTRREREIVNAVFALGNRASVEDIRSRLDTPPGRVPVGGVGAVGRWPAAATATGLA